VELEVFAFYNYVEFAAVFDVIRMIVDFTVIVIENLELIPFVSNKVILILKL
jgi:hypothetical protein